MSCGGELDWIFVGCDQSVERCVCACVWERDDDSVCVCGREMTIVCVCVCMCVWGGRKRGSQMCV